MTFKERKLYDILTEKLRRGRRRMKPTNVEGEIVDIVMYTYMCIGMIILAVGLLEWIGVM